MNKLSNPVLLISLFVIILSLIGIGYFQFTNFPSAASLTYENITTLKTDLNNTKNGISILNLFISQNNALIGSEKLFLMAIDTFKNTLWALVILLSIQVFYILKMKNNYE